MPSIFKGFINKLACFCLVSEPKSWVLALKCLIVSLPSLSVLESVVLSRHILTYCLADYKSWVEVNLRKSKAAAPSSEQNWKVNLLLLKQRYLFGVIFRVDWLLKKKLFFSVNHMLTFSLTFACRKNHGLSLFLSSLSLIIRCLHYFPPALVLLF